MTLKNKGEREKKMQAHIYKSHRSLHLAQKHKNMSLKFPYLCGSCGFDLISFTNEFDGAVDGGEL